MGGRTNLIQMGSHRWIIRRLCNPRQICSGILRYWRRTGAVLRRGSIRETLHRPQVYVMALLGILPGAVYVVYGVWVAGFLGQQFGGVHPGLFLSRPTISAGSECLNLVVGWDGADDESGRLVLFKNEKRRFALGLWAGYFLFGFTSTIIFPPTIITACADSHCGVGRLPLLLIGSSHN